MNLKNAENAYLGAKIGFDTEENELSEVGCAAGCQLYFLPLSSTQIKYNQHKLRGSRGPLLSQESHGQSLEGDC